MICFNCKDKIRGNRYLFTEDAIYCFDCADEDTRIPNTAAQVNRQRVLWAKGITEDDYALMFIKQKGRCAICGGKDSRNYYLSIDHDHITGKVRGLLCNICNMSLGGFKDNVAYLAKAIEYLSKSN